LKTFDAGEGLTWTDSSGRNFTRTMSELREWLRNRADAGQIAPTGFPRNNKFG
jgi:topoisomerase-4 subunit A